MGKRQKENMHGLHIVITGNPVDGLFFYGPFTTGEEALDWADINHEGQDWWIAPLASRGAE